jgi:cyclase
MRFNAVPWIVTLSFVPALVQAQERFANVKVTATHVGGTVFALEGAGGNIGASVGEDGILLVDDQFLELADRIRAALAELGQGKVAYLLNTHYHGDHVGGNAAFGGDATIVAHTNVRRRLLNPGDDKSAPAADALPVVTFEESLSVHFNGEEIRTVHLPHGHTDGDLVVFFMKSKVVHLGDHFFLNRFPFVDIDGGGTLDGYVRNVAHLISRIPPDYKIITGHGPAVATRADLERYHTMLVETVDAVRTEMQAGKSVEQMQQEKVLERWKDWSWEFITSERWIATIHRGLGGS